MTVKRKRRKQIITRAHIWLWSGQPTAPHFKQHPRDERLAAQVQVSCSQFCRVQSSDRHSFYHGLLIQSNNCALQMQHDKLSPLNPYLRPSA